MGGNGLIWALVVAILVIVPFWKILPRYGISKYFAILTVIPAIALVLLWIIAFKDDVERTDS
jgi:hypothetical protein